MHEMAIAVELVQQVVAIAEQHQATRIDEIVVESGIMRQVVPEALELAFLAASEGTIAQGARLSLIEQRMVAVCRPCQREFLPAIGDFVCPQCGKADVRIVAGNDIVLKSVTCSTGDEVAAS